MTFLRPALLSLCLVASPACAQDGVGPALGAASNFGQTSDRLMMEAADRFGITDLRDELYWKDIEVDGRFVYPTVRHAYPKMLAARGIEMSAIINNGHPDYDGGVTPYSPEGVAAFAEFAAQQVDTFPAITSIEVGNEMNSDSFTSGPMRETDLEGRAQYYTALLKAVHDKLRSRHPETRILGGAAHSIPLAWFDALSRDGAAAYMDSVVIHPYTTPPEHLARQIALLRRIPGFETMPVEATEFGDMKPETAAGTLVRYYCQMALSGVSRAVWYALNPRGDGLEPLIDGDYRLTGVGRAYQLLAAHAEGVPVRNMAPDPFTYACQFGSDMLVIWGAPRALEIDPGLSVLAADGRESGARTLSRDAPLIVLGNGAEIRPGENVRLGPQTVLADSYDQFSYDGDGDGFRPVILSPEGEQAFRPRGGQQEGGVPWVPYLASDRDGMLRMNAEFLMPVADAPIALRYVSPDDVTTRLAVNLAPSPASLDGITVTVTRNGEVLDDRAVRADIAFDIGPIALAKGDVLDVVVGTGTTPDGDDTLYRVTLSREP